MSEITIPQGMEAWHGGDSAPDDWDGGAVKLRSGPMVRSGEAANALCWRHPHMTVRDLTELGGDIIAYTSTSETDQLGGVGV